MWPTTATAATVARRQSSPNPPTLWERIGAPRSSTWEEYLMTTYITTGNQPGESRSLGLEERHIFLIRKCTTRCSAAESLPSRPLFTSSPCFNKGFSRVWENNLLRGGRERKGPSTTMTKLNGRLTTEISLAAVAAVRPHSIQSDVFIFLHLLVGQRRRRRSLVCLQQPLKKGPAAAAPSRRFP